MVDKMGPTQILFQILLVWGIYSLLTEASEPHEFDLNKTWPGDETDLIDNSNKVYRDNYDGCTSNICGIDEGTSDASPVKTRPPWNTYIPAENPRSNLETLSSIEKYMSSNGEAANHQKIDLNKFCVDDDSEEINEDKSDENTSTTSNSDIGFSNYPLLKAYLPAKISKSKINTLIQVETHMISVGVTHYWDYSNLKGDRSAGLILCKQIWSTIKAKGINVADISKAKPVCSKATTRDHNVRSGGYYITGHYHYIASSKVYYLNTLRCECGYRVPGMQKSVRHTSTYFLVHKILPKQYLILSPNKPDMSTHKERSNVHIVDFFVEP